MLSAVPINVGIRSSVNSTHANQPSIRDLTLGILTVCLALASFVVVYLQYRKMGLTHVHAHQDENIIPLHAPPPPLMTVDALSRPRTLQLSLITLASI